MLSKELIETTERTIQAAIAAIYESERKNISSEIL